MLVSDPAHRYQVMAEEGIVGECIFPTIGLYVWMLTDPDGGAASCRVYNEWIADGLGRSPRFKCAGLVPTWRPDDAVAEVERIAEAGLGVGDGPGGGRPRTGTIGTGRRCGRRSRRRACRRWCTRAPGTACTSTVGPVPGWPTCWRPSRWRRGWPDCWPPRGSWPPIRTCTWSSSSTTSAGWPGPCNTLDYYQQAFSRGRLYPAGQEVGQRRAARAAELLHPPPGPLDLPGRPGRVAQHRH